MAKRSSSMQTVHDQKVRQEAQRLRRGGWNVLADLPGYQKPARIGQSGFTPDIEATKRGHRRLVEVETPNSLMTDKGQQSAFRRSAAQRSNTTFDIVVTDK
jgi:hypothetical protein